MPTPSQGTFQPGHLRSGVKILLLSMLAVIRVGVEVGIVAFVAHLRLVELFGHEVRDHLGNIGLGDGDTELAIDQARDVVIAEGRIVAEFRDARLKGDFRVDLAFHASEYRSGFVGR